ncbi:tetratricopeptide (TPR) repeat protein [Chitinophagaceae bacterium OAS944]|nr:tetratricopeptide (TPR) repeat protein [Chitinophagaceae bacterium OAS944]
MVKKGIGVILLCFAGFSVWPQARELDCRNLINNGRSFLGQFKAIDAMQQYHEAVLLARSIGNNYLIAMALSGAGQATWYAGNFQRAADTMKLALTYLSGNDTGDKIGLWRILSNIYDDIGDYVHAFKAVQEALALNKGFDRQNELLSMVQVGKLYKNIGDYETAMDYYQKVLALGPTKGSYPFRELHCCLGDLYVARGEPDSAKIYYRQAFLGFPTSPVIRLRLGECHLMQHHIDSASFYLDSLYKEMIVKNDVNIGIGVTIGMSKVAEARGDVQTALPLAQRAFDRAMQLGVHRYRTDAAALLGSLYERQGNAAAALRYQKLFHGLKDSAISDVYKGQLFAFKQKTMQAEQAALLAAVEADKKLAQRTILIVALISVLAIALIIFRHKNEKLRLKQRTAELEMQTLLAQMNPHFIFNCLSAINHSILNKDSDKASEYLTRFSRLMRMVLMNASKKTISLEDELDMVRLYLTMEQLRFKDAFDYTITLHGDVQPSMVQVPGFILQPFCENAIWHGLLHKDGKGQLLIDIHFENKQLIVSIKDDGIGLAEAARLKTKGSDSMGLKLTATRLWLFNQGKKGEFPYTLQNRKDSEGTEAVIRINTR